jgi:hypothetical protein
MVGEEQSIFYDICSDSSTDNNSNINDNMSNTY